MPFPLAKRDTSLRPSFSRDFAGVKTLNHGIGPNITFTRASNATFFDAAGTLRLAPYNLTLHSEDFGNAAWNKTTYPVTVTANQIAAPDGTTSADLIAETTNNTRHHAFQEAAGATVGAVYTMSIYVKQGTQRYVIFGDQGDGPWRFLTFDFDTFSISGTTNLTSSSVTNVGNG